VDIKPFLIPVFFTKSSIAELVFTFLTRAAAGFPLNYYLLLRGGCRRKCKLKKYDVIILRSGAGLENYAGQRIKVMRPTGFQKS